MLGVRKFFDAQSHLAAERGLRQAALLVGLRQENYIALMNMQAMHWDLDKFVLINDPILNYALHLEDGDLESAWANCILRKCSDILQYCYGPRTEPLQERWLELHEYNEKWLQLRPSSFDALFRLEANTSPSRPFTLSWYIHGWHGKLTSTMNVDLSWILAGLD